jgi:hypothetical protein
MLIETQYQPLNGEVSILNTQIHSTQYVNDLANTKEEINNNEINKIDDIIKIDTVFNQFLSPETKLNNGTLPHEVFYNKKRQRTKSKISKPCEFQHELDMYNSNFEFAVKSNNKIISSNSSIINGKMEISENSVDVFNPSIALEEEEDVAI